MPDDKFSLLGLGGSLLVFVAACGVAAVIGASELIVLIRIFADFRQKWHGHLPTEFWLPGAILTGSRTIVPIGIIVMMLCVRRPMVVTGTIVLLWLAYVLLPAWNVFRAATDVFVVPELVTASLWPFGVGLVFAVASTAYLLRSNRVARTFARRVDLTSIFE